MATEGKKGGKKTTEKIGIVDVSKKIERSQPTKETKKSAKSPPKKHLTGSGGIKLKVVSPDPGPKRGAENARKNRLKKAGYEIDICPITGLPLDVGPRANEWLKPVNYIDKTMSWLARVIFESGITADELRKTADLLRKK